MGSINDLLRGSPNVTGKLTAYCACTVLQNCYELDAQ
jgi:hypothetical protein